MIDTGRLNLAALHPLKHAHSHLMLGLITFADPDGQASPSLRMLARLTKMSLSSVQRGIAEMEQLGYLSSTRPADRRRPTIYTIEPIFLAGTKSRRRGNPSPTGGTEERSLKIESFPESLRKKESDSPPKKVGLERCAPRGDTGEPDLRPLKRRNLVKGIRNHLPNFPGFTGNWEAIIDASALLDRTEAAVNDWAARTRSDKQMFDRLVELYRTHRQHTGHGAHNRWRRTPWAVPPALLASARAPSPSRSAAAG